MAMPVLELLAEVRARGVELRAEDDGRLRYRPKGALDNETLSRLAEHKPAIIRLLADEAAREEAEVAWRVAALRPHVPAHGPIILPPVRDGVPPLVSKDEATGAYVYGSHCGSCGEPRELGQTYHCRACTRARYLVVNEAREGVPVPTPPAMPSQQQQQQQQPRRESAA